MEQLGSGTGVGAMLTTNGPSRTIADGRTRDASASRAAVVGVAVVGPPVVGAVMGAGVVEGEGEGVGGARAGGGAGFPTIGLV